MGCAAVVLSMHVPVPAANCNALNLHKNARQPWKHMHKGEHYSQGDNIHSDTVTMSSARVCIVSKVMLTSKVSPWRDFLADAAAYPRDVVH